MTAGTTRIAVISARWHEEIVSRAVAAFGERIREHLTADVDEYQVPGAYEIPFHAQRIARSGAYDAIVACALVVDGGIYRHEFVASAVVDGLMRVQLDSDVPVFSGVLTPHHFHEHQEHFDFFTSHFELKGRELADAVAATLESLKTLPH